MVQINNNINLKIINLLKKKFENFKLKKGSNKTKYEFIKHKLNHYNSYKNNYKNYYNEDFIDHEDLEDLDFDKENQDKIINNSDTLLKQLIDIDFPYVKTSWKENKIDSIDLRINAKKYDYYNILNLYSVNTNIKQFIRTIQFLSEQENEFQIYFWSTNEYLLELIRKFAKEYSLERILICNKKFPVLVRTFNECHIDPNLEEEEKEGSTSKSPIRFLFILGEPWTNKMKRMIQKRIFNLDFILVNHYNFSFWRDTYGMYQIQNDLSDYKKIIVILSLISSVLNSANKDKKINEDN